MPPKLSGSQISIDRFAAPSRQKRQNVTAVTSKNYIEALMKRSVEELKALGIRKPTLQEVKQYSPDQLYEILYGGFPSYFMNVTFNQEREAEDAYIRGLTREINVQDSIYTCPNCAYTRIRVDQRQLRGGDESATALKICTRCGHRWSDSS